MPTSGDSARAHLAFVVRSPYDSELKAIAERQIGYPPNPYRNRGPLDMEQLPVINCLQGDCVDG